VGVGVGDGPGLPVAAAVVAGGAGADTVADGVGPALVVGVAPSTLDVGVAIATGARDADGREGLAAGGTVAGTEPPKGPGLKVGLGRVAGDVRSEGKRSGAVAKGKPWAPGTRAGSRRPPSPEAPGGSLPKGVAVAP